MTAHFLLPLIQTALAEDIGAGDITSELLIPADLQARMQFVAREDLVLAGVEVPALVFCHPALVAGSRVQSLSERESLDPRMRGDDKVNIETHHKDGERLTKGAVIATVSGNARAILTGERTALNIMQRMSGVATLTRTYVDAVTGTKAKILDTRKTMPAMRLADKYAVRMGGGVNHRMGLYDAVLVKDNHIAGFGIQDSGFRQMIKNIRTKLTDLNPESRIPLPILVECDTLAQLAEALAAKPDRIMLDNMSVAMLCEAVAMTAGRVPLEATGGVNLQTIRAIAETGVDYISVGAITHSAPAVDIGLDAI